MISRHPACYVIDAEESFNSTVSSIVVHTEITQISTLVFYYMVVRDGSKLFVDVTHQGRYCNLSCDEGANW